MRSRRSYSYGCLMIRLPGPLAGQVLALAAKVPEDKLYRGNEDAPTGRAADPHVTLKYGLTTFDDEEVGRVVGPVEPFQVKVGRCGVFHNEENIVLKLSVGSEGLVALNKRVCLNLDTVSRYREYLPHVTLAYLRKDPSDPYYYRDLYDDSLVGESFWVDQLHFSTPIGNKYVVPLNGARSEVARMVSSSERVAKSVMARVDVRVSPMEGKVELSDGRQTMVLTGRPREVEKAAQGLKWDVSRMTRMSMKDAQRFVDEKVGGSGLRWERKRR